MDCSEKRCTKCDATKPLSEFFRDKKAKDGRAHECKLCSRARRAAWGRKNQERVRSSKRAYYQANVDRIKQYRQENKEHISAKRKTYRQTTEVRFSSAQRKAAERGLEWDLTLEEYREAISTPCIYCDGYLGEVSAGVGLDRLTNELGYLPGNVVSCCHTCNRIKGHDLSYHEARSAIYQIVKMRKAQDVG
jgi:hypothetical protein